MQIAPVPAMHTKPLVFCAVALATLTRAMGATGMVDPTLISAAAENAVRTQAGAAANLLTLQAAPLDPRLRVASCDRALTGFLTDSSPLRYQTTVGVRCEGSVRWPIYTSPPVQPWAPPVGAGGATELRGARARQSDPPRPSGGATGPLRNSRGAHEWHRPGRRPGLGTYPGAERVLAAGGRGDRALRERSRGPVMTMSKRLKFDAPAPIQLSRNARRA